MTDQTYSYNGWDNPAEFSILSYADFTPDPQGDYIIPDMMLGSDYSGDSVTVANHRFMLENYSDRTGIWQLTGGHWTYGIALKRSAMDAGTRYEIENILTDLEDYPVIDEDLMGEVELKAEQTAWDNWLAHDFANRIEQVLAAEGINIEIDYSHNADVEGEDTPNKRLWAYLNHRMEVTSTYFEIETGNSAYIDVEYLIPSTEAVRADAKLAAVVMETY